MAILIVEHNGTVEGASLSGRILIGRRASNHVVVDDPAVSRIHAWIDTADGHFTVTDAGSRTGTFVNGQPVAGRVGLKDGDQITVGPARLIFRAGGSLPAGVSQLDFADRRRELARAADNGILFDCTNCRAPLWIASVYAGRLGKCRFCGTVVRVPPRTPAEPLEPLEPLTERAPAPSVAAPPAPSARPQIIAAPAETCGICQSSIVAGESSTVCPSCGLTFHADCWTENYGCSAYGCSQVNVLLPTSETETIGGPDGAAAAPLGALQGDAASEIDASAPAPLIPPEHALLAASVAGFLLGALTFGVPALLALLACLVYLKRRRSSGRRSIPRVVLAAIALAAAGVIVGVILSYIWWLRDPAAGGPTLHDGIGVWEHSSS